MGAAIDKQRSNNALHRCGQAAPVFRPVVEARLHSPARVVWTHVRM